MGMVSNSGPELWEFALLTKEHKEQGSCHQSGGLGAVAEPYKNT